MCHSRGTDAERQGRVGAGVPWKPGGNRGYQPRSVGDPGGHAGHRRDDRASKGRLLCRTGLADSGAMGTQSVITVPLLEREPTRAKVWLVVGPLAPRTHAAPFPGPWRSPALARTSWLTEAPRWFTLQDVGALVTMRPSKSHPKCTPPSARQNDSPRRSLRPTPQTLRAHPVPWQRRNKAADRMKESNQLPSSRGDDSGSSDWVQCDHRGSPEVERGTGGARERRCDPRGRQGEAEGGGLGGRSEAGLQKAEKVLPRSLQGGARPRPTEAPAQGGSFWAHDLQDCRKICLWGFKPRGSQDSISSNRK
ncbi:uncharacterized protein LOC111097518 isoform X1 [Canis lupus familiaris]|uniref:uncharacterized protein LOC125755677 n=1 Tax=Canis lupus dingo TaxID=286419 RepID=UPI000BAA2523|nr:uncharacterized protein LOC111097518 isoform X1 [Canis lupus familiaris]XP_048969721.1 uncharacterized protein LOC125755677 [Canis lupus dingo]|eukprot:XP_022279656.1 uncharacterized protein LOC111097518 [Canis lupus familiaris]